MSIPNLPVDFKDDILNTGVNQKRKYQQTYNSDGSVSFEDVTAYQQKGSNFGAQEVNETNGAVNNIYSERILDLDELELVTEPGFFVDAQAVKEAHDSLNSKILEYKISDESVLIGSGERADVTVSFEKSYVSPPTIIATPYTSTGGGVDIAVKNVTNTGFTANMKNGGASAAYFKVSYLALNTSK